MTETEKKIQNLPIYNPHAPNQKYSEKEEKYLREFMDYEFINMEEPGLFIKFSYGSTKNKHTFTLIPGGKYHLPRFIARHVNNKSTPDWKWRPDGTGRMEKVLVGHKPRFQLREVY